MEFLLDIFSAIPSEWLWILGILVTAYLAIKLIVKVVMRVITIATVTIVTYLIKAGIFSQFFQ